ncbi:MAG: hypothetical protein V3W04_02230 [Gammaproteobacteria bacterium]
MKKLLKLFLLLTLLITGWIGYRIVDSNRDVPIHDQQALDTSLESGIQWLLANRETILADSNRILWRMLQKAAARSGDARLDELVTTYLNRHQSALRNSSWGYLFDDKHWAPLNYDQLKHLPEYNQHFIYAMSCDPELAKVPLIAEQNSPDFCNQHRLRPACVTHQMMGVLLLERKQCETDFDVAAVKSVLQDRIYQQLRWDPRGAVDVNIQRVLMLEESGAGERVKPIWIQRILDAQLADGGWSPNQPVISVANKTLSFGGKGLVSDPVVASFHATAQAIYLLSLRHQSPPLPRNNS